jgi:hypothetical protein
MTTDETKRRAHLILRDLNLDPSHGILHTWMAHYVASAITQLEAGQETPALSDQCAATIAKLWELREAQKQRELTSGVNWYMRQADRLNDESAALIRRALEPAAPDTDAPLNGESAITVWQIGKLEEHAISVLWAATRHAQRASKSQAGDSTPDPDTPDAKESDPFEAMEKPILRGAQHELQKVFPDFATLTLEDYHAVSARVHEVLRALDNIRHRILDLDPSSTPSSMPVAAEIGGEGAGLDHDLELLEIDEDETGSRRDDG